MAPSTSFAAASVFALLATGSAERSLLAHKPNGGSSLHGVAVVSGPASTYWTTNGNGTWAAHLNPALQQMNVATVSCPSASLCIGGGYSSGTYPLPSATPANANGVPNGVTAYNMPQLFTSMDAGHWLQPGPVHSASGDYDYQPHQPHLSPFPPTLAFAAATQNPSTQPLSAAANLANGIPTIQVTSGTGVVAAGANPGMSIWPDINNVYCASRTLCFAAAGYNGYPSVTGAGVLTAINGIPGAYDTYGQILRSVNGGTYWSWTTLPLATIANPSPTVGPLGPVGGLNAVSADASGRHVFAVGSPSLALNSGLLTIAAALPFVGPTASAAFVNPQVAGGAILYSGNSGVSFIVQTAPVLQGYFYALNTVAVLRGTIAYAAGGHPLGTQGQPSSAAANYVNSNGIIVATVNGGFSWIVQNIGSLNPYTCTASAATAPAAGAPVAATAFCATVGAAGPPALAGSTFTVTATQALGNIPTLMGLGFYVVPGSGIYTGWAVGNSGLILTTSFNMTAVSNSLTSLQSVSIWSPPPAASLNGAFNNAVMLPASQGGSANIMGIVWDNYKVGYVFGVGFIVSTHNGGASWVSETPNAVISATSPVTVNAVAMVPTSY